MPATYSFSDIYDATTDAIYQLVVKGSQSVSINGRTWTAMDLKELRDLNDWAKSKVDAAAAGNRGTTAVIEFSEPE